jgi:C1A family cysteine protease
MRRLVLQAAVLSVLLLIARGAHATRPLDQIREEIEANGWSFTVDHNWVYDLPDQAKEKMFAPKRKGMGKAVPELSIPVLPKSALPPAWDWRDVEGHSYVSPVRNQGACGSCYAFSATGVAESLFMIAEELPGTNVDLSESYLMFCLSAFYGGFYGCNGASYDYEEMEALVTHGTVDEACYPYDQGLTSDCGAACEQPSLQIQLAGWGRIPCNDTDAIKTAIVTYGPVNAAVFVSDAFQAYSGGVYNDLRTSCPEAPCYYTATNHAIMLVGWDDADQAWILRNSWGGGWGESGYMRIAYTAARVACEAVYANYGQPAPFQMLQPANGTLLSSPPTFYWTKGSYDLFRLTWVLPFFGMSGYVPVPLGWTSDNFKGVPSSLWTWVRTYAWAGAWIVGVNTDTLDYEVQGPTCFMRTP